MVENNFSFYIKRWFLNRYVLLATVILVTGVLFVFNQKKLLSIISLQDEADQAYEQALAQQQASLAALGLSRDPSEASFVEIMTSKDYDFTDKEALKLRDSDNDGLSDYHEIYIYGTSAFLADTDGDSYDDAVEIKAGTDPLCALGDVCGTDNTEKDLAQKAALVNAMYVSEDSADLATLMQELSSIDVRTMDPATLRAALLENGVSASEIDGLTDDEIVALYEMALSDYQGNLKNNTSNNEIDFSSLDIRSMSQEELRAALLQSGLTSAEVDALSDDEVVALFEMALAEYQKESNTKTEEPVVIDESNLENLTADEIRYLLIQEGADAAALSEISDNELLKLFKEAIAEADR